MNLGFESPPGMVGYYAYFKFHIKNHYLLILRNHTDKSFIDIK